MSDIEAARPVFSTIRKGNARGSGYKRNADDWYVEPRKAVFALFTAERMWGSVWDPACGSGNIPKLADEWGYTAIASDLKDRGYGETGVDFLSTGLERQADHIVCNPPYHLADLFAEHAYLYGARHKVAMLVRLAWLEGESRFQKIFNALPPARVLVFRNRISCPPGGFEMPAKGGAVAYCWVVWDHGHRGPTQLDWIRA